MKRAKTGRKLTLGIWGRTISFLSWDNFKGAPYSFCNPFQSGRSVLKFEEYGKTKSKIEEHVAKLIRYFFLLSACAEDFLET